MPRKRKLISIRKPRLSLTKKGLGVTAPSARIGGRSGLNVSRSGVSYSLRSKAGTYNSKRGCSKYLMLVVAIMGLVELSAISNDMKFHKGEDNGF